MTQDNIEEIKSKAGIVDVIGSYISLKKDGANLTARCPFHSEKSPSFTVSPAKGIYKCFGCGKSGDVISFVMEHENKSFPESVKILADKYGIEIEERYRKEFTKPQARLEKLSPKLIEWFEKDRLISNDTLLRMNVTEAKEWMPQHQKEVPVVCFNYYRKEELVNIKFRGPQKSFKLAKDAELIMYNLNALEGEETGIIVEGEMDVLSLVESGIYNACGVPNGTPPKGSNMNLEYLNNCWEYFMRLKTVVIAVDNDAVGNNLKEELGRRIGKEKCKIVVYPDGCKDANDILKKYGKDGVREFISSAKDWPIEGIIPMEDQFNEVLNYFEHGYPQGMKSHVNGFDPLLTFYPGHLTMITGIPGHGKDEFANELMVSLSKHQGMKWGVFNFEEPPAIHTTKLLEKYSKKAFAFRRDPSHRMTRNEFNTGVLFVEDYFYQANMGDIDVTMDGIIAKATELVNRYGIRGIIINPWNYLEHKRNSVQSETEYISEALTKLCNFLWRCGVHCFLVAHPTKMQKDKQSGKYEIPTLYSINGSSHFFNKTHNGICIYRNYDTNVSEVYVQKVKWYWLGQIGWVAYNFNTDIRQYEFHSTSVVQSALPGNFRPAPEIQHYYEPKKSEEDEAPF